MPLERRRVFFSGQVQGVGFRATACWLARGFDVAGSVRNLPDGRVEILAEGESSEIDRFLASLQTEMGHYIRATDSEQEPPGNPPLVNFTVRY